MSRGGRRAGKTEELSFPPDNPSLWRPAALNEAGNGESAGDFVHFLLALGTRLCGGVLDGGEFAHIYFIDWDHVRARHRQLNVTVMGTTEDVNDRKFHGGQTINTLRKYTDEEKAHDIHYTLQLDAREF